MMTFVLISFACPNLIVSSLFCLSPISFQGRKKIADAFIKELVENPMEAYNMDVQSPSVPISFLYDLSNEPSSR